MVEPSAKIILDSVSSDGYRLTTMEVVMHRFVLAEFNTHRMFSRNSASSRAIPVAKQLKRITDNPAIPVVWPAEQSGMQGGDALTGDAATFAEEAWISARDSAISHATHLQSLGVHKSVTNRLLEPFMWHTVIVSSTEWDNFFGLRCNPMAQPEIQKSAYAMRDAYEDSKPTEIVDGWHLPYMQSDEADLPLADIKRISAARCARVSYLTHDGIRDHSKDIELCDRLLGSTPQHSSPLEHVATPQNPDIGDVIPGNFRGWRQFRHEVNDAV